MSRVKSVYAWLIGPGARRGSATWWGFQAVAIVIFLSVFTADGKWWLWPIFGPFAAMSGHVAWRRIQEHKYF